MIKSCIQVFQPNNTLLNIVLQVLFHLNEMNNLEVFSISQGSIYYKCLNRLNNEVQVIWETFGIYCISYKSDNDDSTMKTCFKRSWQIVVIHVYLHKLLQRGECFLKNLQPAIIPGRLGTEVILFADMLREELNIK